MKTDIKVGADMKGLFISFEGPDGGGKTTQLHKIAQWLRSRGYGVVESREPGGTEFAEKVRALVLDAGLPLSNTTQTLLYLAARSEHVDKLLRPALEAGKIVLCDRFSDSTLVYQGLAAGLRPEELQPLRQLNRFAAGRVEPDATLIFDGRPEVLAARREARGVTDRYEQQGLEFQRKLRGGFLKLAELEPERFRIINAEAGEEEVFRRAAGVIEELLQAAGCHVG